jgi:hypothetical protein
MYSYTEWPKNSSYHLNLNHFSFNYVQLPFRKFCLFLHNFCSQRCCWMVRSFVTSQNKSGGAKSGQRNGQWNPKCRELNPSMLYQLHCVSAVWVVAPFCCHNVLGLLSTVLILEVLDFHMGYESYLRKRRISVSSRCYKPTGKHRHSLRYFRLSLVYLY